MKILLIRHGQTAGNLEKRYVGRTDEPLLGTSKEAIAGALGNGGVFREAIWGDRGRFESDETEAVVSVYTSPMRRCVETAELLFPKGGLLERGCTCLRRMAVPELTECDFGRFEYKNYQELNGDPEYQRFLDSGGTDGFPGGETVAGFKSRCIQAFGAAVRDELAKEAGRRQAQGSDLESLLVFVVHGGTIMSVMEAFAQPGKDYYSWQVGNLSGFLADVCPIGTSDGLPAGGETPAGQTGSALALGRNLLPTDFYGFCLKNAKEICILENHRDE